MKKKSKTSQAWQMFCQLSLDLSEDHVSAYATMAAFFLVLSVIPIIIMLLALIQFLPVSQADLMEALNTVFPTTIMPLIQNVVDEVYSSSRITIPITILLAIWSAGKGLMALSKGLNCVHDMIETRNYFYLRFRAAFYTILLIVAIALSLILQVFGGQLAAFLNDKIPFIRGGIVWVMKYRSLLTIPITGILAWALYCFLPNRKVRKKAQIPGAVFTALGWIVLSRIVSAFTNIFRGFSDMYGSLTMIILFMLWISLCMYILLLGAEINMWMNEYDIYNKIPIIRRNHDLRVEKYTMSVRRHNLELVKKQTEKVKRKDPVNSKKTDDSSDK